MKSLAASFLLTLQLALLLDTGCCQIQKPVRLGKLIPDPLRGPDSVSGLVFLLNRETVYFRDFEYNVDLTGFFCGGETTDELERFQWFDAPGFLSAGYSNSDLEFRIVTFPKTEVGHLAWFGVCGYEFTVADDGSGSGDNGGGGFSFREVILASVVIPPQVVPIVPCETTFLGELPTGSNGIAGRVYLLNRLTFAILGFSYDGQAEDAFFWVGAGRTPSITGYPSTYESNIETRLPAFEDQDLVVQVPPDAVGTVVTYFSIWCRSNNVNIGHVSVPRGLITTPPPPPEDGRVLLGPINGHVHNVRGELYALDEKTLLLTNFHYDGTAPGARFWAVKGETVFSDDAYIIPNELRSTGPLRAYVGRTLTLTLPAEITVHDIDWFSVWCIPFRQNFGEVKLPDNIILGGGIQVPTLPPIECAAAVPSVPINCVQLSEEVQMSWVVDDISNVISIELCGCVQLDNYIAFGISGSEHTTLMFGGDATWTWMDNEGVHAGDLDLNAYAQCLIRRDQNGNLMQSGACPDVQNDVSDVSGYRDGCTTCIKYTRPLQSSDPRDRPFLLGQKQFVIWSTGPVGSLDTPLGVTVPVPFRHYAQADRAVALRVNFSRSPLDECSLQCSDCEVPVVPWPRPVLEHTTTINARIGQSGGERGYAGITGTAGWGISWYLNGLLIPEVTVFRGTTYTFNVEGGSDPSVQARYHPFYITSSDRGGYLAKSVQEQQRETIYAGFESDGVTPVGVGRYCEYQNANSDRSSEFTSFEEYSATLRLECDRGQAGGESGVYTWTPDKNTPDTVYYQCATHQFLGWTINVLDAEDRPNDEPPVVECNELPGIRNGIVVLSATTTVGSTATYSCQPGFTLEGIATRTCQASGQWSGDAPTCELIECDRLPNIRNGRVVLNTTTVGSTATYSCQPGFTLEGIATHTCQASGQWSGVAPTCELVECDRLPNIRNGRVVLSTTTVGSTATYSCQPGFTLEGTATRTCQASGQWSGEVPTCELVECVSLPDISNGRVELSATTVGSTATYSCQPGFTLEGTATRTCQASGQWSGQAPTCEQCLTVDISVDYTPPDDFTCGPSEYRAASGPVTVTCTAAGPGTGAVSYQWASTCRSCPFQSATSSSIRRAAVHSGDTGTHTCTATRNGCSASASIDFTVVDAGVHIFRGSPRGNFLNNDMVISDSPAGNDFRFRIFCRSDSMSRNVGHFIGLDETPLMSDTFFDISHRQPGEVTMVNIVGSQNALTVTQQGVYTCCIRLQSGEMRNTNIGVYPSGFNTRPSIVAFTSEPSESSSTLTCTSTGSPATTVSWTRNGQPLTIDGNTYQLTQTVTDRASSTYENVLTINQPLASILDGDNTFTCTVSNALGSVTSDSLQVTERLNMTISVDYTLPDGFTGGPTEYRAASGPVTVTCKATGQGTGAVSYQWSSTCRNCPFKSATSSSIRRAAVHSGDTGTHTCVATRNGISASASIEFNVVDHGVHIFRGSPRGNFVNNSCVVSDSPTGSDFRFRIFCRSGSMSRNVGQFIGLNGTPLNSNRFFDIARRQPGEISIQNIVGSQNALTVSQQGVYTCRIPLQSGEIRDTNVGVYPSGFNTRPSIVTFTSEPSESSSTLTCTSTGSPATTVSWTRNGRPVTIDGNTYQLTQTVTDRASSTYENVLTINQPLARIQRNTFVCTVTNMFGSVTSGSIQIRAPASG